jgi:hypothetical protein
MTIITRLGAALLLVAAVLPFVAADCNWGEFWYEEKSCCLPYGGPDWRPPPPPKKKCPHDDWSWNRDRDCCTPHYPSPPPPECDNDWDWDDNEFCCKKRHPKPSSGTYKRAPAKRDLRFTELCPMGLTACPIASLTGPSNDLECLDTTNELESCGGCASVGKGQDCTAIEGAWNVGCELGTCAVYTCASGFKRSHDGTSCIAN